MKKTLERITPVLFLVLASAVGACSSDTETPPGTDGGGGAGGGGGGGSSDAAPGDGGEKITSSTGTWVVYENPYPDAGTANPISSTIMGTVDAFSVQPGPKMRLVLKVSGLPMNRRFGSHLHKAACDNNKAGGHYQNNPPPDGGSVSDPMYANAMNEAWLDFQTDATGAASSETTVDWLPRAGEAKAVVIHDMATAAGGLAGAKLACINVPF